MHHSIDQLSAIRNELSAEQLDEVAGAFWPLIVVIAVFMTCTAVEQAQ